MKRNSKKVLTLLLAGALCAATVGGISTVFSADAAEAKTEKLSNVFEITNGAVIDSGDVGGKETAKFTFAKPEGTNISSVELDRDLAFKWFTGKDQAQYLNFSFSLADENYEEISFIFETTPYQAVAEDKAINTVKFTKDGVKIYSGDNEPETATPVSGSDFTVQLGAGAEAGEFSVAINGEEVGTFTNIGANYADSAKVDTLVMQGKPAGADNTSIYFKSLNGQAFDNVTGEGDDKKVADTAAPVLVVNQEVSHFLLGTTFNVDWVAVDVLKDSVTISQSNSKYYQWNPSHESIEVDGDNKNVYNISTSSTYFLDTVYEKEDGTKTSVWKEYGEEYVSVWVELDDDTFEGDDAKYELAWYAENTVEQKVGEDTRDYIVLNRNEEGPEYLGITADEATKTNVVADQAAFDKLVEEYNEKLQLRADGKEKDYEMIYAGSNAQIEIPSVDWLFDDDNGFKALNFTISYKTPTATSASTASNKKYNTLKFSTPSEGVYEFKIFASDAAGNTMKYYLDGELVEVSTSNIWDIEEIPTFTFKVQNRGIKTAKDEDKDTLDNKIKGESYTMSTVSIVGASNEKSAYKLYKIHDEIANFSNDAAKRLSGIKFEELNKTADALMANLGAVVESDTYMKYYIEAFKAEAKKQFESSERYAEFCALLDELGEDAFDEISVYDSTEDIDSDSEEFETHDNRFNWSATSRRFTAYDEGLYLILADYWDEDLPSLDRVPAYQLIEVAEEEDTIKGISAWLENNIVSVVLFCLAVAFAIAIVILWVFVKPSEETLEDVDKKAEKKGAKK